MKILIPPKDFIMKTIVTDTDDVYKNDGISVDECLADEIEGLWGVGVRTTGCCCGHGETSGSIGVEKVDIPTMIKLGYKPLNGKVDMFFPKSKCTCKERKKWYRTKNGYIYHMKPENTLTMKNAIIKETDTIEEMIAIGDIIELTKDNEKVALILIKEKEIEEAITMIKYMGFKLYSIMGKEYYDMAKNIVEVK